MKKRAKHIVSKAKNDALKNVYEDLSTKEGEKKIYKIAKSRKKQSEDIGQVKCIKNKSGIALVEDEEINNRWKEYYLELFNIENPREKLENLSINLDPIQEIKEEETEDALRKMKRGKATGPDKLPIEAFKALGREGISLMTNLFNKILQKERLPDAWRKSTLIPIYKNKGDAQDCQNYRPIKLMSHCMKWFERVIERRLREKCQRSITENQFGFMKGKSTTEAIFTTRMVQEKFREKNKPLYIAFIDLEKAYDRVPRELLWWCLRKSGTEEQLINLIKDMYERSTTQVKSSCGLSENFPIKVGLHQGSALSPFLFLIILNTLTHHIQRETPWCLLFADDIMLCSEDKKELECQLELWRNTLEGNGLLISRKKTEYMSCFTNDKTPIWLGEGTLYPVKEFKYLGSVINCDGSIGSDVTNRTKSGWCKWRDMSSVLCDKKMPIWLKSKIHRTVVRPALLYGTECWATKKENEEKLRVTEMKMLRWPLGKTRKDKIKNEIIRTKMGIAETEKKLRESRLRFYGHIMRRDDEHIGKRMMNMEVEGKRPVGKPKRRWKEVIKMDMTKLETTDEDTLDRKKWKLKIRAADPVPTG